MSFPTRKLSDIPQTGDGTKLYADEVITNSVIKFQSTIDNSFEIEFKGFITEMSDNYQSNWDSETVYGRMDPIGTFRNTQRSITLGWTIPAANIGEAKSNLKATRGLAMMLYPAYAKNPKTISEGPTAIGAEKIKYTTANSLAKPPLIRLSYANLIASSNGTDGLLGWVDGFNITPSMEMGFFIENQKQYPKVYTMSCTFNVLHEHDLGYNTKGWIAGTDNWKKFTSEG
mgnify:CR=1 FL=1|tara:strand:+ start:2152 stop:2838 length:687 start_codon:yes stop_codon:yes gene_type:complete